MLCRLKQRKEYNHHKIIMEDPITKDSMGVNIITRRWEAKMAKQLYERGWRNNGGQ
jgi:hypothetical protein